MSPMLTTLDWIIACERQSLLTSTDVRRLRQLVEVAADDFSPRVLLKWLATRDRITAEQADQILAGPPDLTPVDLIIRILGDTADQPDSLDLDALLRDSDESEEDTKELVPLDRESVGELVLPPRGSAPFAGTVTATKTPPKSIASKSLEPIAVESLSDRPGYSAAIDELLADAGTSSAPLPSLKSRPVSIPEAVLTSPTILKGAIVTGLILLAGIIVLWIASR